MQLGYRNIDMDCEKFDARENMEWKDRGPRRALKNVNTSRLAKEGRIGTEDREETIKQVKIQGEAIGQWNFFLYKH